MNIAEQAATDMPPTCAHAHAQTVLTRRANENGTFTEHVAIVCDDCGRRATILLRSGPTEEALLPWTWRPVSSATRMRSGSKKNAPRRQPAASTQLLKEFKAQGGMVPAWIHKGVVRTLSTVRPGKRLLMLGAAGGIIPFAVDRGGAEHVVVTDEPTLSLPTLARTTIVPWEWSPRYGTLWDGIVVSAELPRAWRERLPTLLKPDGDAWLLGPARQYAPELQQAWGYEPVAASRGTPAEYLFFASDMRPLGEGPGTELHDAIAGMGMPECQACRNLAHRMNAWGVAGCRERLEEIVTEILPRARTWWNETGTRTKLAAWWRSSSRLASLIDDATHIAAGIDDLLRDVLRRQVIAAIDAAERKSAG